MSETSIDKLLHRGSGSDIRGVSLAYLDHLQWSIHILRLFLFRLNQVLGEIFGFGSFFTISLCLQTTLMRAVRRNQNKELKGAKEARQSGG